jgi:hypothetical protein
LVGAARLRCDFGPANVTILDLTAAPARQVQTVRAKGLIWQPVGPRKQKQQQQQKQEQQQEDEKKATEATSSSSSSSFTSSFVTAFPASFSSDSGAPVFVFPNAASTSPAKASSNFTGGAFSNAGGGTSLASALKLMTVGHDGSSSSGSSGGDGGDRVTFFSSEAALYSAPPTAAYLAHQSLLTRLPREIAANQAAYDAAVETEKAEQIGPLFLEGRRLKAELMRAQEHVPQGGDVIEVRRSMTLPLGFVSLEGRLYFLQRNGGRGDGLPGPIGQHVTVAQVHEYGEFKPSPFGDQTYVAGVAALRNSSIFGPEHMSAVMRLFDHRRPKMELLYCGERDGMTPQAFHRQCDHKGPTLVVMRTHGGKNTPNARICGGWAGESWRSDSTQYSSKAWLFSLGSTREPEVVRLDPAERPGNAHNLHQLQYGISSNGCMFGQGGQDLSIVPPFKVYSMPSGIFRSDRHTPSTHTEEGRGLSGTLRMTCATSRGVFTCVWRRLCSSSRASVYVCVCLFLCQPRDWLRCAQERRRCIATRRASDGHRSVDVHVRRRMKGGDPLDTLQSAVLLSALLCAASERLRLWLLLVPCCPIPCHLLHAVQNNRVDEENSLRENSNTVFRLRQE